MNKIESYERPHSVIKAGPEMKPIYSTNEELMCCEII
jgi:hypothetical protein